LKQKKKALHIKAMELAVHKWEEKVKEEKGIWGWMDALPREIQSFFGIMEDNKKDINWIEAVEKKRIWNVKIRRKR